MNKLRSFWLYRMLATYVLCPVWLLAFGLAAKARGIHRLRVGKLSLWGDAGFLALCGSSIEQLGRLDPGLHRVLTQGPWAWLFQTSPGTPYTGNLGPPWLFSVDQRYVAWQADGIIARLVYVAFCMSEFSDDYMSQEQTEVRHKVVMKRSRAWLEARNFPEEITGSYADIS